jgi:thymidine phosphorylase
MERFERMVQSQGGSLATARHIGQSHPYRAKATGFLTAIDGQLLGQAIIAMDGGRKVAGQAIDFSVGLQMHCKIGDALSEGQPILDILCDDQTKALMALKLVEQSITLSDVPQNSPPLWRDYSIQ